MGLLQIRRSHRLDHSIEFGFEVENLPVIWLPIYFEGVGFPETRHLELPPRGF